MQSAMQRFGTIIPALLFTLAHPSLILSPTGTGTSAMGSFGSAGSIVQFDFSATPGIDFTVASVSGLDYLQLTYAFTASTPYYGAQGKVFLDAEINEGSGLWYNERGEAAVSPGGASSWEIDEPGYLFGDIYDHYLSGSLDHTVFNGDASRVEDVSLALGFDFGNLNPGDRLVWDILLSETEVAGWGTVLHQWDADAGPGGDNLYLAGRSRIDSSPTEAIPEPSQLVVFALGLGALLGIGLMKRLKQAIETLWMKTAA